MKAQLFAFWNLNSENLKNSKFPTVVAPSDKAPDIFYLAYIH